MRIIVLNKIWKKVIIVIVLIALMFLLVLIVIEFGPQNDRKLESEKQLAIKKIMDNPDIVEYLEKEFYPRKETIIIKYFDKELIYEENGEVIEIDETEAELLKSILNTFGSEKICLYQQGSDSLYSAKCLIVFLGDGKVRLNDYYGNSLVYITNDEETFSEEIIQNWYYQIYFYA